MARLASPSSHKQPSQTDEVSPQASLLALARLLGRIAAREVIASEGDVTSVETVIGGQRNDIDIITAKGGATTDTA
jgi:hypothetical protein